jgi:predicted O-methyltransferase YrrM
MGLEHRSPPSGDRNGATVADEVSSADRGARPATIAPIVDLPYPVVSLDGAADPIVEILASEEFAFCVAFFSEIESMERALMSPNSQALLFCTIRNLKPDSVVEIGTYMASTTEAICRALQANGKGIAHTVDPYGGAPVSSIFEQWPAELRAHLQVHPINSAEFFANAARHNLEFELVFVDGNHDYEFALFDICCAARLLKPNGFIFVDNISQPGPFIAARDFLRLHVGWREVGASIENYRPQYPFDRHRGAIDGTDFCVLRAPSGVFIGIEPYTPGERIWEKMEVTGLLACVVGPATGILSVQCVLRAFGSPPTERTVERQITLENASGDIALPIEASYAPEDAAIPRRIEPWLTWEGDAPLELLAAPTAY